MSATDCRYQARERGREDLHNHIDRCAVARRRDIGIGRRRGRLKAAVAAAEAANKQAAGLRNQWTTTASTLAAAKKFADGGDFDKATASAKEAEALAKASIFQATSEKERWRDLEIR